MNPQTIATRPLTAAEQQGGAAPWESCEQRNMRMGWGCKCHGMTFCPDLEFVGYEDDVPVFQRKRQLDLFGYP